MMSRAKTACTAQFVRIDLCVLSNILFILLAIVSTPLGGPFARRLPGRGTAKKSPWFTQHFSATFSRVHPKGIRWSSTFQWAELEPVPACFIQELPLMNLNNGWETCYRAAVFELDDTKLRMRIGEARYAIALRLSQATDLGMKERRDIAKAVGNTQNLGTHS